MVLFPVLPGGASPSPTARRTPHPSSASRGDRRMPPPPCGARKTLRACAESTLPQCHSRACFATARQWRGCGNCWLPSSATGSGSQQFLVFSDRCGKSALPSTAAGSGSTLFSSRRRLWPAVGSTVADQGSRPFGCGLSPRRAPRIPPGSAGWAGAGGSCARRGRT